MLSPYLFYSNYFFSRIVNFLQTSHRNARLRFLCRNRFNQGFRAGDGRHARHVKGKRGFANRLLVEVRGFSNLSTLIYRRIPTNAYPNFSCGYGLLEI